MCQDHEEIGEGRMYIQLTPYRMTLITLLIAIALFTWAIAFQEMTVSKTEKIEGTPFYSDETITTYKDESTNDQNITKQNDVHEPVQYIKP